MFKFKKSYLFIVAILICGIGVFSGAVGVVKADTIASSTPDLIIQEIGVKYFDNNGNPGNYYYATVKNIGGNLVFNSNGNLGVTFEGSTGWLGASNELVYYSGKQYTGGSNIQSTEEVYLIGPSTNQASAGFYSIKATVNQNHSIIESNYDNNTFTKTITVGEQTKPDLTIKDIYIENNLIKVKYCNDGGNPINTNSFGIETFYISLTTNNKTHTGTSNNSNYIFSVPNAGQCAYSDGYPISYFNLTNGIEYNATAVIDHLGKVDESNENNNTFTKTITIGNLLFNEPYNFTAGVFNVSQLNIGWTNPSLSEKYIKPYGRVIYRSEAKGNIGTAISSILTKDRIYNAPYDWYFDSNVKANTNYYYTIKFLSKDGLESNNIEQIVGNIGDPKSFQILNSRIENITSDSAIVRWETDKPATSRIWFSPVGGLLDNKIFDLSYKTIHEFKLNALQQNTSYYCVIASESIDGYKKQSENKYFTPTTITSSNVCIKEGESLGAVVSGNNKQCCEGLKPFIVPGIIGTRGICKKIEIFFPQPTTSDPQIIQINTSAGQLHQNKLDEILSELKQLRDKIKEQASEIKYLRNLTAGVKDLAQSAKDAINNFITYGVDSNTQKLGAGERAAVINSYKSAFDKLPETEVELTDAIKIANGRFPSMTNDKAEKKAKEQFIKIYKRIADMNDANDSAAIKVMSYGLRQKAENRNLNSEKTGIKTFKAIYGFTPKTTEDWNAMQAITYSGSAREKDSDGDLLSDEMEARYGTNPNKADTDGDGHKDGEEVGNGYDPLK